MLDEEEENAAPGDKKKRMWGFTSVSETENQKANTGRRTKN